jgi:hypothetical protein
MKTILFVAFYVSTCNQKTETRVWIILVNFLYAIPLSLHRHAIKKQKHVCGQFL